MQLAIIDYGVGNLKSLANLSEKIEVPFVVTQNPKEIEESTHILLPGVGHFGYGIKKLKESNLIEPLEKAKEKKIWILGVCLGMQLFAHHSEEAKEKGLGWLNAEVIRFKTNELRIPHVGFNTVEYKKKSLLNLEDKKPRFYFTHSYHMVCKDPSDILSTTEYGYEFTSMVQRENIFGAQFHPEKSHKFGIELLKNFTQL